MKRTVFKLFFFCFVLTAVLQMYGQAPVSRRRLPTLSSAQERDFMAHYPTGTNDFGRSCQQQADFDRDFVLPSFLGWTFGDSLESYGAKKLAKPFRLFDTANLCRSAKNRLCEISLELKAKDYSMSSISNELVKLTAVLRKQFGISIYEPKWDPSWLVTSWSALSKFENGNIEMEVYGCYFESGDSNIKLTVRNRTISKEDQKIKKEEDRIARTKKEKTVSVSDTAGSDMLMAKRPNVSTEPKEVKFGATFGKVGPEELLEPILPLEEAVKLAKKDEPKGYYQMAIIISRRKNWRDKEFDADRYAAECWNRAVSAGYKNALAIDAILKDEVIKDDCAPMSWNGDELAQPGQLVEKYSGMKRSSHRIKGSLASPEDVKAQRALYEEVIKMGYQQMTNALAFFEWRAARVAAKKAKEAAAKADSDELSELVKSVVTLPKKETPEDRSKRIAAAAKSTGSVYIKTANDENSAATGWDDKQGKPLTIEFWDAWNGDVRELRFSADGKLIYVSPATSD